MGERLEVVVTLAGALRTGELLSTDGTTARVRLREGDGWVVREVPAASVVPVEPDAAGSPRPWLKLAGLGAVGVVGLALVLHPGSSRRLSDALPAATAPATTPSTTAPAPAPSTAPVVHPVVLFGDAFIAGRGVGPGTPTAASTAARLLSSGPGSVVVLGGDGTAYTTGGRRGGAAYALRLQRELTGPAPSLLLLQGGSSDTGATVEQLTAAAGSVVDGLRRRFPSTRLVMMGPVAVARPLDGQLVRVDRALAAVAASRRLAYLSPISSDWVPASQSPAELAPDQYYPNALGQAALGRRLAAELRPLLPR